MNTINHTPVENDRLLKQPEVERILGMSAASLEQWRLKGKGPKFCKLGRSVRYRESDLRAYIAALPTCQSTTQADAA